MSDTEYEVFVAGDGEKAIRLVERETEDVIVDGGKVTRYKDWYLDVAVDDILAGGDAGPDRGFDDEDIVITAEILDKMSLAVDDYDDAIVLSNTAHLIRGIFSTETA